MQYSFINYNLTLYFTSLIYFITGNKFSSHLPLAITNLFQPPTYSLCLWACFSFFLFTLYDLIFKILHISEIIWYLSFSVWLISLRIMPSNSTHIKNGNISFSKWSTSQPWKERKFCHLQQHAKWNKSDRERQILYDLTYMWNLRKKKKLIEKEIRFVAIRGRDGGGGGKELEKGGQKVQISNHKIHKY